ncbi:MAG: fimbrillin family protein, partial [Bacteroidaceae bacterium]|nr:fimbrillin family protein [Bacteroidaceae bacterium]
MKKYLFLTALVGASLASCTQEEIDLPKTGGDSELITFASPVVGNMTRANVTNPYEVGNNYPTDGKFAVWAHYYTGNFNGFTNGQLYMEDVILAYKNVKDDSGTTIINTWAPDSGEKNYYWPKNGTLTFIGYSPASAQNNEGTTVTVGATGIKFNNYEVSTEQSNQVDLLFSERSYNQKKYKASDKTTDDDAGDENTETGSTSSTTNDPYTGAHLEFKHALSSILFNVKTDRVYSDDKTVITLTGITLKNVVNKATFDQGLTNTDGGKTSEINSDSLKDGITRWVPTKKTDNEGNDVVVVVSAQGDTTDELID